MSSLESNPAKLLRTLDEFLCHPVSLVLYGRASLALGFDRVPQEIGATKDVDFLVRHDRITRELMEPAFANVRMPDVVDLHDAFARALPSVRGILDRHAHSA
jgi:hypothetical protein